MSLACPSHAQHLDALLQGFYFFADLIRGHGWLRREGVDCVRCVRSAHNTGALKGGDGSLESAQGFRNHAGPLWCIEVL